MKMRCRILVPALTIALGASAARALPDAQATAGRLLLRHYADAVVTIKGTITMKVMMNNRLLPFPDTKVHICGTVISPQGLVVSSLSAVDPHALFEAMKAKMPGGGSNVDLGPTEFKNLRFQFGDGTEVDAKIVYRDAARDLVLLAPDSSLPAGQTLTCVDLQQAPLGATVLGNYFEIARLSETLQRAAVVRPVTVIGIIERPHRVLLTTADAAGCPVFNDEGHVLGVCLQVLTNNVPSGDVVMPASAIAEAVSLIQQ